MNRWPSSIRVLVITALAVVVCACEPFTEGDNNGSNCQLAITDSSGSGQVLSNTSAGAQAFIPTSSSPFLTIQLLLNTVSTTNTNITGTLFVQVEPDLNATSTTPTQPQCSPFSTCGLAFGSLDISTIAINQPVFYTIPLSGAVTPVIGSPLWVTVAVTYGPGSSTNIVWSNSAAQTYPQGPSLAQAGANWSTTPLPGNFDIEIGCQ